MPPEPSPALPSAAASASPCAAATTTSRLRLACSTPPLPHAHQSVPFDISTKFSTGLRVFGFFGFGLAAPFLAGPLALYRGGRTLTGVWNARKN